MSFFKNLHFVAVARRRSSKRTLQLPIESKPVNECLRNLAYIIKRQQSLNQNIFYLIQRVLGTV